MKVIIIAAGYGSRLGIQTKELPKALVDINGKSILDRQSELLQRFNLKEIIVVTGPNKDKFTNQTLLYIEDRLYQEHEQLGSLMAAHAHFDEELLVLFSDVLFDQQVLSKVIKSKCDIGIAIDTDWKKGYDGRTQHPIEQADLALVENNNVVNIQKNLNSNNNSTGEFIGIMKLSQLGAKKFLEHFNNLKSSHKGKFQNANSLNKAYLIDMLQDFIEKGETITPIFIDGEWCEIDTPQDLEHARSLFN
jgi:choline kinase